MNICVFGASYENIAQIYKDETYKLGKALAEKGCDLVYGGGQYGLMGTTAKGFAAGNGKVIGIAPKMFLGSDVLYPQCDEMIITDDLQQRKDKMIQMADVFVVVPGGLGTYDEMFEVLIDNQLGYIKKDVIIFNVNGYFDAMIEVLQHTLDEGFMSEKALSYYKVCDSVQQVLKEVYHE